MRSDCHRWTRHWVFRRSITHTILQVPLNAVVLQRQAFDSGPKSDIFLVNVAIEVDVCFIGDPCKIHELPSSSTPYSLTKAYSVFRQRLTQLHFVDLVRELMALCSDLIGSTVDSSRTRARRGVCFSWFLVLVLLRSLSPAINQSKNMALCCCSSL
jgi:hypothetical protein